MGFRLARKEKTPGISEKIEYASTPIYKSHISECRLSKRFCDVRCQYQGMFSATFESHMPDLKFERSRETRRISFKGQNMPDVMILVSRKRGMYCFFKKKKIHRRVHCLILKTGNE